MLFTAKLFMLATTLAAASVSTASPINHRGVSDNCVLTTLTDGEIERTVAQGGCISFETNSLDTYRACGLFTEPLSEWDCQKWQAVGNQYKDEFDPTTAGNATTTGQTLEKRYPCSQCPSICAFARGTGMGSIALWSSCMGTCYVSCY
ncbi:hypothetical protein I302_107953 [Kwoniella bestiolae CBS 10118]|uniref:Uncharacterized protein n=1 Tax=Kwoniella bestiolae CBS 10118 TaxID=1296100 RepID=A0A1B9FX39_9TREE|nr:hypothetical protein I302_07683 [Kwoniella bestiolae CBS 10118]OCF23329.1 hypothetical protein I302_07683 [Kwoniella bestiolae CBS 10118]